MGRCGPGSGSRGSSAAELSTKSGRRSRRRTFSAWALARNRRARRGLVLALPRKQCSSRLQATGLAAPRLQ